MPCPITADRWTTMNDRMYGPFNTPEEARDQLVALLGEAFEPADVERLFIEACTLSEVDLGEYDRHVVKWVSGSTLKAQALRAIILRAYDAGCARGEATANSPKPAVSGEAVSGTGGG